jgi:FMN-dependent NADH-azoreductase
VAAPYNIGDSTLAAEALRLIADKLSGAKNILALNSVAAATLTSTKAVAVLNGQGSAYHVYIVNTEVFSITASLALGAWGVTSGWPVIVERVNSSSYGEVSELLTAGVNGGLSVVSSWPQ